jgi:hypothetical protein
MEAIKYSDHISKPCSGSKSLICPEAGRGVPVPEGIQTEEFADSQKVTALDGTLIEKPIKVYEHTM